MCIRDRIWAFEYFNRKLSFGWKTLGLSGLIKTFDFSPSETEMSETGDFNALNSTVKLLAGGADWMEVFIFGKLKLEAKSSFVFELAVVFTVGGVC